MRLKIQCISLEGNLRFLVLVSGFTEWKKEKGNSVYSLALCYEKYQVRYLALCNRYMKLFVGSHFGKIILKLTYGNLIFAACFYKYKLCILQLSVGLPNQTESTC